MTHNNFFNNGRQQQQTNADNEEDEDEDSDFGNTDDEDEENDLYLRELKGENSGDALERDESGAVAKASRIRQRAANFGDIVKKSMKCYVIFTLYGVDECARIDEVFDNLAKGFPKTKFVRILPELDRNRQLYKCATSAAASHRISKIEDSRRGRTGSISLVEEMGFQKRV